jgi:hypothetical protein
MAFQAGTGWGYIPPVAIGYAHTQCRVMTSRYTGHLLVEALSGYKNGQVREHGRPERIYRPAV